MATPATSDWTRNHLLNRLPNNEFNSLIRSVKAISLAHGDELYRRQESELPYVFFPTSGMISLTVLMENGKEVEAATVGNEGMIGLPVVLGLDFHPTKAISQISGEGLRIPAPAFLKALKPGGTFDKILRRYIAYSLGYASQIIACNLLHSVEKRMCRWLLMSHDRVEKKEFVLTHEFLAKMLGVRRQTVTVIAGTLQTAGILSYRRGVVRILNRGSVGSRQL